MITSGVEEQLVRETAEAEPAFEELLELVIETTLRDPQVFQAHLEAVEVRNNAEPSLARKIGILATNQLIEAAVQKEALSTKDETDGIDPFLLPCEPAVQNKIEALGASILEEAFECLGPDATKKVRELQQAVTLKQKIEVCNWLLERIEDIRLASREKFEEAETDSPEEALTEDIVIEPANEVSEDDRARFYHPARLSPKFIGKFPSIKAEPTCLAYSILMSSFFEKAGVPYMHAGVVSTATRESKIAVGRAILSAIDTAKEWDIDIHEDIKDKLSDIGLSSIMRANAHDGFHAAILVRFEEDAWVQLDPNYKLNVRIGRPWVEDTEESYQELLAKSKAAKGIEVQQENRDATITGVYILAMLKCVKESPKVNEIEQFLQDVSADEALSQIFNTYFREFFVADEEFDDMPLEQIPPDQLAVKTKIWRLGFIQEKIHDTLLKYVFSDAKNGDISASIERCKRDPAYRKRRAEDLKMAPLYALLSMQTAHVNEIVENRIKYAHAVSEAGLPAYRIGAAVLSDFASYCGDELPLSFWMTYWPGGVGFAEHYEQTSTPAQEALRSRMIKIFDSRNLNYGVIDGIIRESTSKEDDSVG